MSAILLFVSMRFDWFGSKSSESALQFFSVGRGPWDALDYIPIFLSVVIVATVTVVVLRLVNAVPGLRARANAVIATLGAISALLILFRIVLPPNFGSFREVLGIITIEGTAQPPIFLALLAALGIAFGGYWAMRDERAS